jgi:FkbM family methyltransferase
MGVLGIVSRALTTATSRTEQRRLREVIRLQRMPRDTPTTTTLLGPPIQVPDAASFLSQYHPIVRREMLRFPAQREHPYIIDCGANVGTSVIWFRRNYPDARILAFEADPQIHATLASNCQATGLDGVDLRQQAVWTEEGFLDFAGDGNDGGHLVTPGDDGAATTARVPTVRLRDLLDEPVDMLKIDIEGAEGDVLLDCADRLHNVRNACVEYHSFRERPQVLPEILAAFRDAGLRFHVLAEGYSARPLVAPVDVAGMDNQLNLFAYRAAS